MEITIAIDSQYFAKKPKLLNELDQAFEISVFDRCQISLKPSDGNDWLNRQNSRFFKGIDVIKKHDLDFIASIAAYQDNGNTDQNICVQEAKVRKSELKLKRICPSNTNYQDWLIEYLQKAYDSVLRHFSGIAHLSYFRFENFNQCVCKNCLKEFQSYRKRHGLPFVFKNFKSLLDKSVARDWVNWRKEVITSVLNNLHQNFPGELSIEIDFDESKRYLAGAEVEDGLDIDRLLPNLTELYLHIEPANPQFKIEKYLKGRQKKGYINYLHYINSLCSSSATKCCYFYWFLKDRNQIETNLSEYVNLARSTNVDCMVFYTGAPLTLAQKLEEIL